MKTNLSIIELSNYISCQLNCFFPDRNKIDPVKILPFVELSLNRLSKCLSATKTNRYKKNGETYFNHLFTDAYMLYLCYLSNTVWNETADVDLSSKIYYLNKTLHSFDCMYDTNLPEIFLIIHGFGTIMGKAEYGNYFVIFQGCTVGAINGRYPKIGKGVCINSNSSVIGKCEIGNRVTVGLRTAIVRKNITNDCTTFMDPETGILQIVKSQECYAQQFFGVDLKTL